MSSENKFSSVDEAINYITSLPQKGSGASLNTMKLFMEKLGNPQNRLRFVHIAGSNGKGSCAKYISDALSLAGYKTGLFISPYILEFRERISVDGEMIEKEKLLAILNEIIDVAKEVDASQFELITAIAVLYYLECDVDIVVLETGLGGRFDATNVVLPILSVIMQISLDHTELLGDSEEEIAAEKAGIIKEGRSVVLYPDNSAKVNALLCEAAKNRSCRCLLTQKSDIEIIESGTFGSRFLYNDKEYSIQMQGVHQVYNAATAIETLIQIAEKYRNLTYSIISRSIAQTAFVARFELLRKEPLLIIDGAHNIGGAKALSKVLSGYDNKFTGVFGAIKGKNYKEILKLISPFLDKVYLICIDNPRAASADELLEAVPPFLEAEVIDISDVLDMVAEVDCLVFGSLYLCSDIRNLYMGR